MCSKNGQIHQFALLSFTFHFKKSTFRCWPFFSDLWHAIALFIDFKHQWECSGSGLKHMWLVKWSNFFFKCRYIGHKKVFWQIDFYQQSIWKLIHLLTPPSSAISRCVDFWVHHTNPHFPFWLYTLPKLTLYT